MNMYTYINMYIYIYIYTHKFVVVFAACMFIVDTHTCRRSETHTESRKIKPRQILHVHHLVGPPLSPASLNVECIYVLSSSQHA